MCKNNEIIINMLFKDKKIQELFNIDTCHSIPDFVGINFLTPSPSQK